MSDCLTANDVRAHLQRFAEACDHRTNAGIRQYEAAERALGFEVDRINRRFVEQRVVSFDHHLVIAKKILEDCSDTS